VAEVILDKSILEAPSWHARDLVGGQAWNVNPLEPGRLTFRVPRKDGAILQLQGA